jgi:hypothetical protein
MLSPPIVLTPLEMALTEFVARQRIRDGMRAKADEHKYGFDGDPLAIMVEGCRGECIVAKALNVYWTGAGVDYSNEEDVGRLQVRTTHHRNGCLLHRPNEEHHDDPWILVIGEGNTYHLAGWLYGHEIRRQEWLREPAGRPPAYFAPQGSLRPFRPVGR